MQYNLKNKTALITGSSRVIGKAIARLFAHNGARLAIHYNNKRETAEETLKILEGKGHMIVQADLAHEDAPEKIAEEVISNFGRIDILVNNAGIYEEHPFKESEYNEWKEKWERITKVNLIAPANLSFFVAGFMKESGGGRIINISSRGAFRGEPDAPAYAASKAGMNAMSQSMAKALAPFNIYVYAIAPGFVETDMAAEFLDGPEGDFIRGQSPLNRVAKPKEIANTAAFLASEGAEFLTGGVIDINGASYLR